MTNFIFKSASRLIKNSPTTLDTVMFQLLVVQKQNRLLRGDVHEISLKLEKLLIDKHLQMQVDEYFTENEETSPQTDIEDKIHEASSIE